MNKQTDATLSWTSVYEGSRDGDECIYSDDGEWHVAPLEEEMNHFLN